jgi:hypothetical protein
MTVAWGKSLSQNLRGELGSTGHLYGALYRIAPMHVWGCQLELDIFMGKENT